MVQQDCPRNRPAPSEDIRCFGQTLRPMYPRRGMGTGERELDPHLPCDRPHEPLFRSTGILNDTMVKYDLIIHIYNAIHRIR